MVQKPSYAMIYLVARVRFGLRKRLGNGATREAWLTRKGTVLKLPIGSKWDGHCSFSTKKEYHDPNGGTWSYYYQTLCEAKLMAAGKDSYGQAMAKGQLHYLLGVPVIEMEYVCPQYEYFSSKLSLLPGHHGIGVQELQLQMKCEAERKMKNLTDGQWGVTHDGRTVCYDAGCEC